MIQRILFSFLEGIKHRAQLKTIPYIDNITSIDWQAQWDAGIRVVVLDFDGVLAADRQQQLCESICAVLLTIIGIYGSHVYIFSNQPTPQRQAYFAEHFPHIQFLVAKQKPYPDGLLSVIIQEQVSPEKIVLVDDRVLTGGLAATLAGIECILIKNPTISFSDNPLREIVFFIIRIIERGLFR